MLILWLGVLFRDIRICVYKYRNSSLSWLAAITGADPGMIGSRKLCLTIFLSLLSQQRVSFPGALTAGYGSAYNCSLGSHLCESPRL